MIWRVDLRSTSEPSKCRRKPVLVCDLFKRYVLAESSQRNMAAELSNPSAQDSKRWCGDAEFIIVAMQAQGNCHVRMSKSWHMAY